MKIAAALSGREARGVVTPRVTVVVPCYDHGAYLPEALASIEAQTFQDFEVLVVDDGSTDPATRTLLDGLSLPRTTVIRSDHRGLPGARNVGIRAARGELVCCVDADDVLEPTLLERSVAYLDAHPDVAFVSHWLRAFGDEEWEWTPESCSFPALLDANTVNGAAVVRRRVLLEVALFDESMTGGCEDWDLWITLVERGQRGAILPEFLFRYRRRADSMSRRMARGGGNVALFARLAARHPEAYREHLEALFLRRSGVIADLVTHTHRLRVEEQDWLGPELRKKREHLEALRAKAARAEAAAERARQLEETARLLARSEEERQAAVGTAERREREIVRMSVRVAGLLEEKARLARRTEEAEAAALAERAEAERQRHDARAMRRSLSWRLTGPLRALHAWLARRRG